MYTLQKQNFAIQNYAVAKEVPHWRWQPFMRKKINMLSNKVYISISKLFKIQI